MDYRSVTDAALLESLRGLAARERRATAEFMACLAEADRREKAVIAAGYPSLFVFCVRDLRMSESSAYKRTNAARLIRSRPEILSMLADGSMNLFNLCLIEPWLESRPGLLEEARRKSKREVEALIASIGGRREVPDRVRALAVRPIGRPIDAQPSLLSARSAEPPPSSEPAVEAPAKERPDAEPTPESTRSEPTLEIRFAASSRFILAVERLRSLLWHKYPSGRFEDVLFEAASAFIAQRDPARTPKRARGQGKPPLNAPRSRRIPAWVRRAVWRRDRGRCSFLGPAGRCGETRGLEIDHVRPWALGGSSDLESNLRLLCRAHNQSEARRIFESPRGEIVDHSRGKSEAGSRLCREPACAETSSENLAGDGI